MYKLPDENSFLRERGSVLLDNLTGKVTVKGKGKLALSLNFKGNTLSYYTLVRTAPVVREQEQLAWIISKA